MLIKTGRIRNHMLYLFCTNFLKSHKEDDDDSGYFLR